ncbi:MAG: Crp/Fnr family transcriptional regulator [Flavobacteriales bacterium]|nr:Crp/Fnr family transcriptional regulator [Flavobacteriales bacterium]
MRKEFLDFFRPFTFLSLKDIQEAVKLFRVVRAKKGEVLIMPGSYDKTIYTLLNGYVRNYVDREDGEEITTFLAGPRMSVGAYRSALLNQPSNETVVVLENATMIAYDMDNIREMVRKNDNLNRVYSIMMERSLTEAAERVEYLTILTPEQRYLHLLEKKPEIVKNVPQKYIASYIGITPVSLSRIRARLVRSS